LAKSLATQLIHLPANSNSNNISLNAVAPSLWKEKSQEEMLALKEKKTYSKLRLA